LKLAGSETQHLFALRQRKKALAHFGKRHTLPDGEERLLSS